MLLCGYKVADLDSLLKVSADTETVVLHTCAVLGDEPCVPLDNPTTRASVAKQVHWTIGLVGVFYGLVMALGYAYGVCSGGISDNILNDFG